MIKWLIEYTKKWKHRNMLHVLGGMLIGLVPNILFAFGIVYALITSILISFAIGHYWEKVQVKNYNATYSKMDIFLSIFGAVLTTFMSWLFQL